MQFIDKAITWEKKEVCLVSEWQQEKKVLQGKTTVGFSSPLFGKLCQ